MSSLTIQPHLSSPLPSQTVLPGLPDLYQSISNASSKTLLPTPPQNTLNNLLTSVQENIRDKHKQILGTEQCLASRRLVTGHRKSQIPADKHKGKKYFIVITWSYQDNGKFQRPWRAAMEEGSQSKTWRRADPSAASWLY